MNKRFIAHKHDLNEQMGYLVKGRIEFVVGDEQRILRPGDIYRAPIGVLHSAWTFEEPSVLLMSSRHRVTTSSKPPMCGSRSNRMKKETKTCASQ